MALDPTTGRWTAMDPIGFAAGDANLYRYVGNRPTDFRDPLGLMGQTAVVQMLIVMGGIGVENPRPPRVQPTRPTPQTPPPTTAIPGPQRPRPRPPGGLKPGPAGSPISPPSNIPVHDQLAFIDQQHSNALYTTVLMAGPAAVLGTWFSVGQSPVSPTSGGQGSGQSGPSLPYFAEFTGPDGKPVPNPQNDNIQGIVRPPTLSSPPPQTPISTPPGASTPQELADKLHSQGMPDTLIILYVEAQFGPGSLRPDK